MIAVIGCGNLNRQDDAAGVEVIRILRRRGDLAARDDVSLLDAGTDGMLVMFAAKGCDSLIVVDSARTGEKPGAIFEIPGSEVETEPKASFSLHDFRWDHALHVGRQMYKENFPSDVMVYLIEARNLEFGLGLSPEVAGAAAAVANRIAARLAQTAGAAAEGAGASAGHD